MEAPLPAGRAAHADGSVYGPAGRAGRLGREPHGLGRIGMSRSRTPTTTCRSGVVPVDPAGFSRRARTTSARPRFRSRLIMEARPHHRHPRDRDARGIELMRRHRILVPARPQERKARGVITEDEFMDIRGRAPEPEAQVLGDTYFLMIVSTQTTVAICWRRRIGSYGGGSRGRWWSSSAASTETERRPRARGASGRGSAVSRSTSRRSRRARGHRGQPRGPRENRRYLIEDRNRLCCPRRSTDRNRRRAPAGAGATRREQLACGGRSRRPSPQPRADDSSRPFTRALRKERRSRRLGDTLRTAASSQPFGSGPPGSGRSRSTGRCSSNINNLGHVTAGFEGGRHDLPSSVEPSHGPAVAVADRGGCLEERQVADAPLYRERLERATQGIPRIVEMRYRHVHRRKRIFRMRPGSGTSTHTQRATRSLPTAGERSARPRWGRPASALPGTGGRRILHRPPGQGVRGSSFGGLEDDGCSRESHLLPRQPAPATQGLAGRQYLDREVPPSRGLPPPRIRKATMAWTALIVPRGRRETRLAPPDPKRFRARPSVAGGSV